MLHLPPIFGMNSRKRHLPVGLPPWLHDGDIHWTVVGVPSSLTRFSSLPKAWMSVCDLFVAVAASVPAINSINTYSRGTCAPNVAAVFACSTLDGTSSCVSSMQTCVCGFYDIWLPLHCGLHVSLRAIPSSGCHTQHMTASKQLQLSSGRLHTTCVLCSGMLCLTLHCHCSLTG